jgi:hypothetical protein
VALALVRDGDAIYVGRTARLDRIDARTGAVTTIAGPEWAECPRDPSLTWLTAIDDYSYPNLVVRGTTLTVVKPSCGVWSFDVATKQRRMLVDPSLATKEQRVKAEGVWPEGATWNGKTGPNWVDGWGMALASDGDGLVGCFTTSVHETLPASGGGGTILRDRLELWSISAEGTPREQLAALGLDRASDGKQYCEHVLVDPTSIVFSTEKSILRWDRQTRALKTLVSELRFGPWGLAQDATHLFYINERNEVRRLSRATGETIVIRTATDDPRQPARTMLTLDGDRVYFHDGYSLMRMNKDGTDLIELAAGREGDWVLPMTLGIGDHHLYFERLTSTQIATPSAQGTIYENTMVGSLFRTAR